MGEEVEIQLVCGQPWSAYNWYLGQGRSRIDFNTDLPLRAHGLMETLAHEAYPGHHTEGVLKEQLYLGRGYAEAAIAPLNTPANVVAEGIGDVGLRAIMDNRERLIEQAAARTGDLPGLFRRLLTEQWRPTMLGEVGG